MVGNSTAKVRARVWLKRVRLLKTWQLIVLLLIGIIVSATFLRLNNLGMVERRSAVIKADESGDRVALRETIVELQKYVAGHMNTNLDKGFFLTKTYERDREVALAEAGSQTNPNSSVYQQASIECRSRFVGGTASFRNDYVTCVIERVSALSSQQTAEQTLNLPKADAYRISFASPVWSPDLAGLFVAICFFIVLVILSRAVSILLLRALLRRHYSSR